MDPTSDEPKEASGQEAAPEQENSAQLLPAGVQTGQQQVLFMPQGLADEGSAGQAVQSSVSDGGPESPDNGVAGKTVSGEGRAGPAPLAVAPGQATGQATPGSMFVAGPEGKSPAPVSDLTEIGFDLSAGKGSMPEIAARYGVLETGLVDAQLTFQSATESGSPGMNRDTAGDKTYVSGRTGTNERDVKTVAGQQGGVLPAEAGRPVAPEGMTYGALPSAAAPKQHADFQGDMLAGSGGSSLSGSNATVNTLSVNTGSSARREGTQLSGTQGQQVPVMGPSLGSEVRGGNTQTRASKNGEMQKLAAATVESDPEPERSDVALFRANDSGVNAKPELSALGKQAPAHHASSANAGLQVAAEMNRNLQNGQTRFQMRLDPPELGRVDVNMRVGADGAVQAHLIVERPETLDMFLRDQRGLERALESAGLNADGESLKYSLRDGSGQNAHSGNSGNQPDQGQRAFGGGREQTSGSDGEPSLEVTVNLSLGETGLDIRV
ncbi:flagellar hook-length control protein FliK [Roseibium sp. RKSG952]|uniref:flagellar hook-length control protein FliK n=1 Tax=Roseibium sp. RKSG952 TaxID=2529384 RepID=UPI0018AD1F7D|nr:flagellar hook-length control protein FliK [Roseibium sp. RKSG952]